MHLDVFQEVEIFGLEMGTVGKMVSDLPSAVSSPFSSPVSSMKPGVVVQNDNARSTVTFCYEFPAVRNLSGIEQ